jgi:uncharacterized Zn finger protein
MRKLSKGFRLLAVACILAVCLFGCGSPSFDAAMYVKGTLDATYLGAAEKSYLEITDSTAEEITATYLVSMEIETDYFLRYFEIEEDYIPSSFVSEVIEMYKQIYAKSKYEIGDVSKSGDNYLVSVTIHPIDIIEKVIDNDIDGIINDFYDRADNGDFDDKTDEEIETVWARNVIDAVKARVGSIGYLSPETISVQVVVESETRNEVLYAISDNDLMRIDSLIIQY